MTLRSEPWAKPQAGDGAGSRHINAKPQTRTNDPAGQLAADALDGDLAIIGITLDGLVTSWDTRAESLFGLSGDVAIGRRIDLIASPHWPRDMQECLRRLSRGERMDTFEPARKPGNGQHGQIQLTMSPILDLAGRIAAAVIIARDLAEPALMHALDAEQEAQLRPILQTAPKATIGIDPRGIIKSFDQAAQAMFGYAPGEVIGRSITLLTPAPDDEIYDFYLAPRGKIVAHRRLDNGRLLDGKRKDGSVFPVELTVGEAVSGKMLLFTAFLRDQTRRVALPTLQDQSDRLDAMGQLAGAFATDFSDLLRVIGDHLETIERRDMALPSRQALCDAHEVADRAAFLARRLLAFGRRQPLHPEPVDLDRLIAHVIKQLRHMLGPTVDIETIAGPILPLVAVDPEQIKIALLTLALNARDAMPEGGKLTLETSSMIVEADAAARDSKLAPGAYVMLTLADTGSGMSAAVRGRAFEPFFTTKPRGAGLGLGLSMVHGFIRQSGGHVRLYSDVGEGTTVLLCLPALTAAAPASFR